MELSNNLVRQFAKAVNGGKKNTADSSLVMGTVEKSGDKTYVKIDGSDSRTPVASTTDVLDGERVTVVIKNHEAFITGNFTSPSARSEDVKALEKVVTDKVDTKELTAIKGDITNLHTKTLDIDKTLTAQSAKIKDLDTKKLSAEDAELKFANIDFSNIGKAAMEYFLAKSGLIKDVTIGDATITGELVGVTIKGSLIEGGTIVADKLVIQGEDGLYYKLNTDGKTVEKEQTDYNSLNGQVIQAKSVTAEKIDVKDLVAFGATIGGFKIGLNSLFSGVKESVDNTTRGIYMDTDGQFALGDTSQYFKYYKNADGQYVIDISAASVRFGVDGKSVEEALTEIKDEVATILHIESSRGTAFKNNCVSTILSVVIFHGKDRITDSATMREVFGSGAYLQWYWQRLDDESFGVISSSDTRFGDDGFTFTLSPSDVDAKITFRCELIA